MCGWYVILIFSPICFYSSAARKSPQHVVEIMFIPIMPISTAKCVDVCSLNKRWVSKWNKHHRKLTRGCSTPAVPHGSSMSCFLCREWVAAQRSVVIFLLSGSSIVVPERPAASKCRRTKVGIATPERVVLCCESEVQLQQNSMSICRVDRTHFVR